MITHSHRCTTMRHTQGRMYGALGAARALCLDATEPTGRPPCN